jgi:hypothetical protein
MGDYGFRATNANTGSIQIDSTYANLLLIAKATTSSVAVYDSGDGSLISGISSVSFTFTSSKVPVVAFSCASYVAQADYGRVGGAGTTWTWTLIVAASAGASLTYYIFDTAQGRTPYYSGDYGLRVRDAAGNVTFDSRFPALALIDIYSGTAGSLLGSGLPSKSYSSGPTFALAALLPCFAFETASFTLGPGSFLNIETFSHVAVRMNGTALQGLKLATSKSTRTEASPIAGSATVAPWAFFVIDVTHL